MRTSAKAGSATKADENGGARRVVGSRVTKNTATPKKTKAIKQEIGDDADMEDENEPEAAEGHQMFSYDGTNEEHWENDMADINGDFESGFYGSQI